MSRVFFPRFQAAKDPIARQGLIRFILLGSDRTIVDALFAILKNPHEDLYLREEIFGCIAHCGRPDVLKWIVTNRRTSRRLSRPNPKAATGADSDGDGLSDALDASPYAAPRPLNEAERAMKAAFESQVHFGIRADWFVVRTETVSVS